MIKRVLAALTLAVVAAAPAVAACPFRNEVPVKSLSGAFDAWKAVTAAMAECGNVQSELDAQFRIKQPAAFAASPALYQIGGVSNGTVVPLLDAGTIRPLDDLVAKYGQHLKPNQLIRIGGRIMVIAMDVNTQNFMYRADIFRELGLTVPTTYDEVLDAAAKIKASGKVAYPMGATTKAGFDLGLEFVNLFMSYGGSFTDTDNKPSLAVPAGTKALETLKAVSAYLDPEYLTSESTFVQKQFQQKRIAMANFWTSRAAALDDPKESQVAGQVAMAAAPAGAKGGKPASALWWDGFVIAKNITDAEAEAAFRVALVGIGPDMVKANNNLVIWLGEGYTPTRLAEGALSTAAAGAPPYPSSTVMGMIVASAGDYAADFLTGKKTAEQTLAAMEASYLTKAREQGLVK